MTKAPGVAALLELRDEASWFDIGCDTEKAVHAWRSFGFTPDTAQAWIVAMPEIDGSPGVDPLVAASFLSGGLTPEEATRWIEALLGIVEPTAMAAAAQEWSAAGFAPQEAGDWGEQVPIEVACEYRAAGWTVWEALLHLEWLGINYLPDDDPTWLLVAPVHAIAYARAGIDASELPTHEARRRRGESMSVLLGWNHGHEQRLTPWTRRRLADLSGEASATCRGYGTRDVVGPEVAPLWEPEPSWPASLEPPQAVKWSIADDDHWDGYDVPPEDYGCPEDHALDPFLEWTEEHETAVTAWLERRATDDDTAMISAFVEWPPRSYLTSPGYVSSHYEYEYSDHPVLRRDCEECLSVDISGIVLEPARWVFSLDVQYEITESDGEMHTRQEHEHLLTLTTDPRSVEYTAMPQR